MGSPSISTLTAAIHAGYTRIPALSEAALRRHPPQSIATAKGHLDRNRQGCLSTKAPQPATDTCPSARSPATNMVYCSRQYIDLTGRFPVSSDSGSTYILLFYAEDANYIHVEPLPDRSAHAITTAFRNGQAWFNRHRILPHHTTQWNIMMDNESSSELQRACNRADLTIQFCPPGNHRANRAERCIRTFKNHVISIMAATDPEFPLSGWDYLLDQAEITLNLLRGSHINPLVSAWEQLHGGYDYNAHPLAPPGVKVLAFEDKDTRESWAPHGRVGFYVGPAMNHYRCFRIYMPETKKVRIVDTLSWHPAKLLLPGTSPVDDLTAATRDMTRALRRCADSPITIASQRQPNLLLASPSPLRCIN